MKKILFVVHSHYMLIIAIHLRTTIFKDDIVDVIYTNSTNGSNERYQRIIDTRIFDNVYYLRTEDIYTNSKDSKVKKLNALLRTIVCFDRIVRNTSSLDGIQSDYTDMFVYTTDRIEEQTIFSYIKNNNDHIHCHLYEEGFISYIDPHGVFYTQSQYRSNNILPKFMKLFGKKRMLISNNVVDSWFFNPEFVQYDDYECHEIPELDYMGEEIISKLNYIFDFNSENDKLDEKFVFIEDSLYQDKIETDDIELLENIATTIGKNEIIVKMHPRTKDNRFNKMGMSTSRSKLPLELITLNNRNRKMCFVTVSSGGPLNCIANFKSTNVKCVMLYKCSKYKVPNIDNKNFSSYIEKINLKYGGNSYFAPESVDELIAYIKDI